MTAVTESKSPTQNRLEGFVLTALFQGLPTFAGAVLLLKLTGAHDIVGERWGAAIFVVMTSILYGMLTPWIARKFPKVFRQGYEPLFFDASLSFSEKIAQWRMQPATSLQLVTTVMMMSILAVGAASIH